MADFVVGCEATIGRYVFRQVNGIEIKSSWKELVDTCLIKLPLLKGKINPSQTRETLADSLKAGDEVKVKMSYKGLYGLYEYTEFEGFVRSVSPGVPMEVECENAVYLLRRTYIQQAWRTVKLSEIVQYIVDEVNKAFPDRTITLASPVVDVLKAVTYTKFRIDSNAAVAIDKLKDELGLAAYFRGRELYVGFAYSKELQGQIVPYNLAGNVVNSDNLKFRNADDVDIRLKAIAILPDNKQITVTVPENTLGSGEVRTQLYTKVSDKATLKKLAEQDLQKFKFSGLEGELETLLIPPARHSDVAVITDPEFENRSGSYLIDSVETTFGRGIRRKVKIGIRV